MTVLARGMAGFGGALVLLGVLQACWLAPAPLEAWRVFQGCLLLIGIGALVGGLALGRGPRRLSAPMLALVVVVAVSARVLWIPLEPNGDVYRYLWEGMIQLEGHNPYALAPDAPELERLRPVWFEEVNHAEWSAIYGPLVELGLAAMVAVFGISVTAAKGSLIALDLLGVVLLWRVLRKLDLHEAWIVGYAWHPLVLWHVAGEAHLEGAAAPLLAGLLLALASDRDWCAGGCAAGLALIKPTGLLLWPLLVARRWRSRALLIAPMLVLLGYWPYLDAGEGLVRSLWRFGSDMRFNDLPTLLVGDALGKQTLRVLAVAALLTTAGVGCYRRWAPAHFGAALTGAFLLVSPTVHPWYAIPLCMCTVVVGRTPWWVLTVTLILAGETAAIERESGQWLEPGWTRPWVYYPALAILLLHPIFARRDDDQVDDALGVDAG